MRITVDERANLKASLDALDADDPGAKVIYQVLANADVDGRTPSDPAALTNGQYETLKKTVADQLEEVLAKAGIGKADPSRRLPLAEGPGVDKLIDPTDGWVERHFSPGTYHSRRRELFRAPP